LLREIGYIDRDRGKPDRVNLEIVDELLERVCIAIRKIVSILGSIGVRPESERHRAHLPREPPLVNRTGRVSCAPVAKNGATVPTAHPRVAVSDCIGVVARLGWLR
jgi:hypothetical protein